MQNGNSLLTGAESRVTLKELNMKYEYDSNEILTGKIHLIFPLCHKIALIFLRFFLQMLENEIKITIRFLLHTAGCPIKKYEDLVDPSD